MIAFMDVRRREVSCTWVSSPHSDTTRYIPGYKIELATASTIWKRRRRYYWQYYILKSWKSLFVLTQLAMMMTAFTSSALPSCDYTHEGGFIAEIYDRVVGDHPDVSPPQVQHWSENTTSTPASHNTKIHQLKALPCNVAVTDVCPRLGKFWRMCLQEKKRYLMTTVKLTAFPLEKPRFDNCFVLKNS